MKIESILKNYSFNKAQSATAGKALELQQKAEALKAEMAKVREGKAKLAEPAKAILDELGFEKGDQVAKALRSCVSTQRAITMAEQRAKMTPAQKKAERIQRLTKMAEKAGFSLTRIATAPKSSPDVAPKKRKAGKASARRSA